MSKNSSESLKISIGMPVYNGELFLSKSIESLLSQTFREFELIISDNASTDNTQIICEEYSKKDSRIKYFRQAQNMGAIWNFKFVLDKAKSKFFMWSAADDIRHPEFLQKTYQHILSDEKAVGCMSKARFYDLENLNENIVDTSFRNFILNIRYNLRPADIIPIKGPYYKKVKIYLRKSKAWFLYSLFRTESLRKSFISEEFYGIGLTVMLNILRYGNLIVVDENLTEFYIGGLSKKGLLSNSRQFNKGIIGRIFPFLPLTNWCAKNLGNNLFLKNLDYFILLNIWGEFLLLFDLIRLTLKKFS